MTAPREERSGWSIQEAEQLLLSLKGVMSVRLVTRPGGEISEIHLLTTEEVTPKQTVRNVESALLAHLDLSVDHRKISVAQSSDDHPAPASDTAASVMLMPEPPASESRLLFRSHQVTSERGHRFMHRVEIEWHEHRHVGEASAPDLARPRMEAVATATLSAVEEAFRTDDEENGRPEVTLALDGVKVVHAFDRTFILVAVHAIAGRDVTSLAGATVVEESTDRAAILATLQATDRWVRGRA